MDAQNSSMVPLTEQEKEELREHTSATLRRLDELQDERKQKFQKPSEPIALTSVVVHWKGPYSEDDIFYSDEWNGLYLLFGRKRYQRETQIQYCGVTEGRFRDRLNKKHHKLSEIKPDTLAIWLGAVVYPTSFQRDALELAEHCFVHFWRPKLNTKKIARPPSKPVCLITQWFNQQWEPRLIHPPVANGVPDVFFWDEKCWRTGRLTTWEDE